MIQISKRTLAETILTLAAVPAVIFIAQAFAPEKAATPNEAIQHDAFTSKAPAWLHGLWMRADIETWSEDVEFHYFHDDGQIGLYRYGKRCLNNTHSYNYAVTNKCGALSENEACVAFHYRKSGQKYASKVSYEKSGDDEFLTLAKDPETGKKMRYKLIRPPVDGSAAVTAQGEAGWDRMWTDINEFKTGGMAFSIYQFKKPGMDHRGIGWFHRGDLDDWSTESLTYRRRLTPGSTTKGELELSFTCAKNNERSAFHIDDEKNRSLHVVKDPRNFWAPSVYKDGGKSFAANITSPAQQLFGFVVLADESVPPSQPTPEDDTVSTD